MVFDVGGVMVFGGGFNGGPIGFVKGIGFDWIRCGSVVS